MTETWRPSELEAKFLLLCLFGMGFLASWADSEAVLPAYLIGMVLAGTVGKDHMLIRRLRTLTFGLLTPFYFIRAGSFVSVPALIAAPAIFLILLAAKIVTKIASVYPVTRSSNWKFVPPSFHRSAWERTRWTFRVRWRGVPLSAGFQPASGDMKSRDCGLEARAPRGERIYGAMI